MELKISSGKLKMRYFWIPPQGSELEDSEDIVAILKLMLDEDKWYEWGAIKILGYLKYNWKSES